jgi:hypothetical protein
LLLVGLQSNNQADQEDEREGLERERFAKGRLKREDLKGFFFF